MTYRNSIGDISVPGYSLWIEKYDSNATDELVKKNFMITLIWAVWILN